MKVTDEMLSRELVIAERERELETFKASLKKTQFIEELKNGLGGDIKEIRGKVTIIKRPWHFKLKQFLKKIFTRF